MTSQPFTVLMADDDIEDIELVEDAIRASRIDIHLQKVLNGRAALHYLEQTPDDQLPCLIILDYNMPELNGSEVLSELSKEARYHSIAKVILSTSNSPAHIKECKDKGAIEYFVKPTTMEDLNKIVQKLMVYCRI
ncbi:MAG: response regulator [Flavisolibacter sp.]|nr:response regulator [Flavisolibacter sp.]